MSEEPIKIRAQSAPWMRAIQFLVISEKAIGTSVVMEEKEGREMEARKPTFSLGVQEAQTLMDDLWQCGLRPTEGTGSAGSLRATERHLEDMRRLVFDHKQQ